LGIILGDVVPDIPQFVLNAGIEQIVTHPRCPPSCAYASVP
jgi:hypothetical protein